MSETRVKISVPTPIPGVSEYIHADKIIVELADGRTFHLEYLLTKLVELIAKEPA